VKECDLASGQLGAGRYDHDARESDVPPCRYGASAVAHGRCPLTLPPIEDRALDSSEETAAGGL